MSTQYGYFVGIDISKKWIDVSLVQVSDPNSHLHHQFGQSSDGYRQFKEWIQQQCKCWDSSLLICMEHTGLYNQGVVNFLLEEKMQVWVEMAVKIKKASGLVRGQSDKTDSLKIALYAYRYQDKAVLWNPVDTIVLRLKNLLAQRDRLLVAYNQLQVPIEELTQCGSKQEAALLNKHQHKVVRELEKAIKQIEVNVIELINENSSLKRKVDIVGSIKGIGMITAIHLLVYTNGFNSFDAGKQLACYCGVVPFSKESGTSVRSKPTVSPFANKKLKMLLHMCALSACRFDGEIKGYYERKVAEGKNKMVVLNAVRNKLVLRICALIRDNRTYEENYVRKCA